MGRAFFAAFIIAGLTAASAVAQDTPISREASTYIVWPKNGMVIHGGKLWVRMGIKNAGVAPAGEERPNTGHHHLIVDAPLPPMNQEIPADKNHLHFGAGQTYAAAAVCRPQSCAAQSAHLFRSDNDHRALRDQSCWQAHDNSIDVLKGSNEQCELLFAYRYWRLSQPH